jgi:hypothetical protein
MPYSKPHHQPQFTPEQVGAARRLARQPSAPHWRFSVRRVQVQSGSVTNAAFGR